MLTPREQDVVSLITEGLPNKQIATKLKISVRTVETHRKRAFHKLGVHSGVELMRRDLKDKLEGIDSVFMKVLLSESVLFEYPNKERIDHVIKLNANINERGNLGVLSIKLADAIREHLIGKINE